METNPKYHLVFSKFSSVFTNTKSEVIVSIVSSTNTLLAEFGLSYVDKEKNAEYIAKAVNYVKAGPLGASVYEDVNKELLPSDELVASKVNTGITWKVSTNTSTLKGL